MYLFFARDDHGLDQDQLVAVLTKLNSMLMPPSGMGPADRSNNVVINYSPIRYIE